MMNQAVQYASQTGGYEQQIVAAVPRVNIHAFCDNQQTVQAMQAAAADRRMSRAHVTIQLGGIMAAVQVFQSQPTPNVLIVTTALNLCRWTQLLGGLDDDADLRAKRLRYRYLAVAALVVRSGRRLLLRLPCAYPLVARFAGALNRLRALPGPST